MGHVIDSAAVVTNSMPFEFVADHALEMATLDYLRAHGLAQRQITDATQAHQAAQLLQKQLSRAGPKAFQAQAVGLSPDRINGLLLEEEVIHDPTTQ